MTFVPDFILDEPYLVFVACWGSGKTLLMMTKAMELNELGQKVLILVFLNGKEIEEGQKSLLILDLEEKLKEYQNVTVKGVRYTEKNTDDASDDTSNDAYEDVTDDHADDASDGDSDNASDDASDNASDYYMKDIDGNNLSTDGYDHIFVDEYFEDLIKLNKDAIKKFKDMLEGKKTVWVSLSNSYTKPNVQEVGSDPSEYLLIIIYKLMHKYSKYWLL